MLATSPLPESLHAAHRLGVPGRLIQIVLLTYRYVFLLATELEREKNLTHLEEKGAMSRRLAAIPRLGQWD